MKRIFVWALFATVACMAGLSCKKEKDTSATPTSKLSFRLTDGPADYDAVYVDIQQIELKQEGRSTMILYPHRRGPYNLLQFRNGMDTLLLSANVPPGRIEQVRLILGGNNYIVDGGQTYPLNTPSAQESGVKLNLHTTLEAGVPYDIWIDFDAGKSINKTGNGAYKLKPVIRAYSAVTNGRIEGYVMPLSAFATVYASNGGEEYAAIPSRMDGRFVFSGLPEGRYAITVEPGVAGFVSFTAFADVRFGTISNLGTIMLMP